MTGSTDTRTRRALIVGVDTYGKKPLDGCVADARLMELLLRERFAFRPEHVRLLVDGEATRDAVLAELDALVDLTGEDDVAFVFYAGHGSRAVDEDEDEGSGFDSTLMVSDTPRQDILDDELRDRLDALARKTPHTVLVIDACNAGTITRDAFATQGRWYPPTTRAGTTPDGAARGAGTRRRRARRPDAAAAATSAERYVLIAACRDGEIANEATLPDTPELHHGALTYSLARALYRARPGDTWRDVFERAAAAVTAVYPAQHPQLEGAADRELFGLRDFAPISTIRVTDRASDSVVLSTGAAFGATVGSTWTVFPAGTKAGDDTPALGTVEVVVVNGTSARARIVEESSPGAIVEGSRAAEASHAYAAPPLAVQLMTVGGEEGDLTTLRAAIASAPALREVRTARAAAVRVLRLAPRTAVGARDPLPELGLFATPRWAIVDRGGRLVAPVDPAADAERIVQALLRRASFEHALALDNADPASRMRGRVTLEVLRRDADGAWAVAEPDAKAGVPVFDSGERFALRVRSTLEEPVFVTLLDFDPSGAITRLTKGNSNVLAPGNSFALGMGTRGMALRWDGPDAVESFKVVATRREVDFGYLERPGESARAAEAVTPLSLDDWSSAVQQVVVRRRIAVDAAGAPVTVDGARVTVRGARAVVRSAPGAGAARGLAEEPGALERALDESGLVEQQALVLAEGTASAEASRVAGDEPAVEIQVSDPGEDVAQVAMTVDEHGVVSWHFAEASEVGEATRGEPAARTRTFRIPLERTAAGEGEATRGLASAIGQKLIKVYAFPLGKKLIGHLTATYGEQLELQRTPYRVRTFTPDDYASPEATVVDAASWERLAQGPALLMIHGTNSRTHTAFGGLPRPFVEEMHRRYEGRVFAFDHPTLTHTPRQNIEVLLAAVPEGLTLEVDIVCHSRGGLVSRVLSEKQGELGVAGRQVRVRKVVFVGTPNAGTRLADEACIGDYIDTATNLLDALPTNGVTDALGYVLTGVKLLATGLWTGLKGLQSMQPGGPFGAWLNAGDRGETAYFALTSDYTPTHPRLASLVANRLVDQVFRQARNDMVVPTDGVYEANGSGYFPIEAQLVLGADDGVAHTQFFQHGRSTAQIAAWLGG